MSTNDLSKRSNAANANEPNEGIRSNLVSPSSQKQWEKLNPFKPSGGRRENTSTNSQAKTQAQTQFTAPTAAVLPSERPMAATSGATSATLYAQGFEGSQAVVNAMAAADNASQLVKNTVTMASSGNKNNGNTAHWHATAAIVSIAKAMNLPFGNPLDLKIETEGVRAVGNYASTTLGGAPVASSFVESVKYDIDDDAKNIGNLVPHITHICENTPSLETAKLQIEQQMNGVSASLGKAANPIEHTFMKPAENTLSSSLSH
ncbi:UNVERIFIED_CONTAM: hypothetical protein HDU68_002441 [Siphonaria sp. JEL0065]|nr:hypothetical protein HDU68_002441 [Siphonaria sp. JEL0065]